MITSASPTLFPEFAQAGSGPDPDEAQIEEMGAALRLALRHLKSAEMEWRAMCTAIGEQFGAGVAVTEPRISRVRRDIRSAVLERLTRYFEERYAVHVNVAELLAYAGGAARAAGGLGAAPVREDDEPEQLESLASHWNAREILGAFRLRVPDPSKEASRQLRHSVLRRIDFDQPERVPAAIWRVYHAAFEPSGAAGLAPRQDEYATAFLKWLTHLATGQ